MPPIALIKLPFANSATLPVIVPLLVIVPLPPKTETATLLVVRPDRPAAMVPLLLSVAVWLLFELLMVTTGMYGAPGALTVPELITEIVPLALEGLLAPLPVLMPMVPALIV